MVKRTQQNQITAMTKTTIWKNFKVLVTPCGAKILWIVIITALVIMGCRATRTIIIHTEVRTYRNK